MATCATCKKRVILANPTDDPKTEVELVRVDGPVFRLKAYRPAPLGPYANMAYDNTSSTYEYHQCETTNEAAGLVQSPPVGLGAPAGKVKDAGPGLGEPVR